MKGIKKAEIFPKPWSEEECPKNPAVFYQDERSRQRLLLHPIKFLHSSEISAIAVDARK